MAQAQTPPQPRLGRTGLAPSQRLAVLAVAALILVVLAILLLAAGSNTTSDVSNAEDSGPGSLRQAILDANANPDLTAIRFRIGTGPAVIALRSPLPELLHPTAIDGYSQPGAKAASEAGPAQIMITIDGQNAGAGSYGLVLSGPNSSLRGLAIVNFSLSGVLISGIRNQVEGCYIGLDSAGKVGRGNYHGVNILGGAWNTIGGPTAAARNVISGNKAQGIYLGGAGAVGNLIEGNYIGLEATGTTALANAFDGIAIVDVPGTRIRANVVAANLSNGLFVSGGGASDTQVEANFIGANVGGVGMGNALHGILATGVPNLQVGPNNLIIANGGNGLLLSEKTMARVSANSISSNGGLGLGYDSDAGVAAPILENHLLAGNLLTIDGKVAGKPGETLRVEFFANEVCDTANAGEGQTYLGASTVTVGLRGEAVFSFAVGAPKGRSLAATATGSNGTSVFSGCLNY
jgi:hypothetical protein